MTDEKKGLPKYSKYTHNIRRSRQACKYNIENMMKSLLYLFHNMQDLRDLDKKSCLLLLLFYRCYGKKQYLKNIQQQELY